MLSRSSVSQNANDHISTSNTFEDSLSTFVATSTCQWVGKTSVIDICFDGDEQRFNTAARNSSLASKLDLVLTNDTYPRNYFIVPPSPVQ